jgi:predicted esterase
MFVFDAHEHAYRKLSQTQLEPELVLARSQVAVGVLTSCDEYHHNAAVEIHSIPTLTHGRVLVRPARAAAARGVLVGFHGYMENAAVQMQRQTQIPEASQWTLVSIQGLHRFYRPRSEEVVASWMTREDREAAIADNLAYVAAALDAVPHDRSTPIVYAGFSQGVAMAFRAAVRGPHGAAAIIAVGGDVPPELLQDASLTVPRVLLARGERDAW